MSKSKEDKHVVLSKEGVKITDYQFHYLDVLKNQQTRQLLRQHLKSEHNVEPLDFLDAVEKLKQLPFDIEKTATHPAVVKEALSIFDTYVAEKSLKEINISAQIRYEVENKLNDAKQRENPEKWMLEVKPSSLYSNIADTVMLEMEKDSFPRFVRSALFLSFMKNQNKAFIQSIGNLKTALEFDYTDEDFLEHIVKDRDFEFMDRLMEDRYDWELVGSDKKGLGKVQAFWSNKNYLPNVSYMKKDGSIGKNTAILPYSLEVVMRSVVPGYNVKNYDANVSGFHQYKYYTNEELKANPKTAPHVKSTHRSCAVVRFDVVMPFPMTTLRRYLVCTSITYDPEKQMFRMLHKPCELTTHPLGKKEYEMKDFQCWFLKRLDGERTLFTQIHLYNCRGWASSPKLQKFIIFEHGRGQQKGFKKVMDIEKAGKAVWDPNDYLIKLMQDAHIPEQDAEYQKNQKRFSTFGSLLPINQSLLKEASPLPTAATSSEEEKKKFESSSSAAASSSVAIEPLAP